MWTRLDACVSAVAAEVGLDPDRVTQDNTNIKRWINDTRQEIYNLPVRLSAAEFVGEFAGTANVTAGTVAATLNQAEVTGTTTSWTAAMGGRYLSISTGMWQRVSFVTDTTHLTLESSWNQASVTGQSYRLWKRDYFLPNKVGMIMTMFDMGNARFPLAYYEQSEFYIKYGFGDAFNPPLAFTQFAQNELGAQYLNATTYTPVTATANSPILDFAAGSGLVTAIANGDRMLLSDGATSSTAFAVDRILTDTKIALTELVTVSNAAISATAFAMNRIGIRVYPAIDNTNTYYYEAYKRPSDLVNAGDLIEEGWYPSVKKGAIAKACGYIRDPREPQKLQEYAREIQYLIRTQYKAKNPSPRLKPHIPRRYGTGGFFGYFPSKYDMPY